MSDEYEDEGLLNEENEQEEELDLFDFMVEDKEDAPLACLTCKRHKVGSQVCGIFKGYNDFIVSKGKDSIEEEFSCSEYKEL